MSDFIWQVINSLPPIIWIAIVNHKIFLIIARHDFDLFVKATNNNQKQTKKLASKNYYSL